MSEWIKTSERLPKLGVVVETKIDDAQGVRNEGLLKRQGNLWFTDDGAMYVYYTPTHWKQADPAKVAARLNQRKADLKVQQDRIEADLRALEKKDPQ